MGRDIAWTEVKLAHMTRAQLYTSKNHERDYNHENHECHENNESREDDEEDEIEKGNEKEREDDENVDDVNDDADDSDDGWWLRDTLRSSPTHPSRPIKWRLVSVSKSEVLQ